MSDVLAELRRLLRERLQRSDELAHETRLVADLQLDSIQQLDLIVEIENHFEISLEPEDGEAIETVGELVAWIDRSREAQASGG